MGIKVLKSYHEEKPADALILPFFEKQKLACEIKGIDSLINAPLRTGDFIGKKDQVLCHYPQGGKEKRLIFIGLGKEKNVTKEVLRRSYASAIQKIKKQIKSVNICLPQTESMSGEDLSSAVAEGVFLSNYTYDLHKSEKEKKVEQITFIGGDSNAIKKTEIICENVCFTRDLIFSNADLVTPTFLGKVAKEISQKYPSCKAIVFGRKEIKKQKFGLLEAVSRGASTEPALIILEYWGDPKSKETTVLVGKGISFDTGGLNLKPTGGIETMRDDMSGAGAVLGTVRNLAALKLPLNVVAIVASTENAIGPDSYKPGDVFLGYGKISVEIGNTDAEGRLVLADAISYAQEKYHPTRMIDIATLTGGAVIALGEEVSALMGTDKELMEQLILAGESTYERLCILPLYEEYEELLHSEIADIKNVGGKKASPITAGIFLKKFIKKTKWAHIDIAGTAFPEKRKTYQPIQAAGVGVRLLTKFLENLCKQKTSV